MRTTIVRSMVVACLIATAVAPARADDRGDRPDADTPRATGARVRMLDNLFRPRALEIARGTRVKWVNVGELAHTATARNGAWDSGNVDPGDSWSRVFRRAGTFRYVCVIHADMTGRVIVT